MMDDANYEWWIMMILKKVMDDGLEHDDGWKIIKYDNNIETDRWTMVIIDEYTDV